MKNENLRNHDSTRGGATPRLRLVVCACLIVFGTSALAQDVAVLSLEDLLNTEVSTVSRKSQRLSETAAAVFVVTGDEIQRSGATSIPEALRMVPGVQVARMGNARWSVSARGFNGRFANKLLVLMDGRSIYSPLFSGVIWEQEDTLLEDIDRIEVIRGPGAAMWGANAVNGVINIITKRARATQGGMVSASAGNEDRAAAAVRWGGALDESTHYRVWAKGLRRDASDDQLNIDPNHSARAGFRLDKSLDGGARASLIGETYRVRAGDAWERPDVSAATLSTGFVTPMVVTAAHSGSNVVGRYDTVLGDGSELGLQAYFEHSRLDVPWAVSDSRDTADVDLQHRLHRGSHDFMWGMGYRVSRNQIHANTANFSLLRDRRLMRLFSAFAHDEWTLVPDRLRLIAGTKIEHNGSTGWEWQPNVRLAWTPSETRTVWGALSRAVRTPAQAEEDASLDLQIIPPSSTVPLSNLIRAKAPGKIERAEKVTSFDLGYREQLTSTLSLDIAAFAARYSDLRTGSLPEVGMAFVMTPRGPVPYLQTTTVTGPGLEASTRGVELAADWHPLEAWRLQAAYTYLYDHISDPLGAMREGGYQGKTPRHSASLRSSWNLARNWQFDGWLRRTGGLQGGEVAGYNELDLRLAWRPVRDLEVSLVGQNLLHRQHLEWIGDYVPTPQLAVERAWYIKAKLAF
ncbi:MAG: TonB-dependent receptor [Sterolibacteriaceae bacterium]|nr:TonB-dependent receptor [Candidatus Methylophosphatis haderslevensis]